MTLETFRKAVERMKERGEDNILKITRLNLEASKDEERLSVLDEVLGKQKNKKTE